MAIVDLTIPIGKGERDELTIGLSAAGDVELRQLGQVVTIGKSRRVEMLGALVVAYKAVDHMTRERPTRGREG